jgi:putative sigma-54 modulation protein
MRVEIHSRGFELTPPIKDHALKRLHAAVARFEGQVAGVYMTLQDVNGPRGGLDKQCSIRVAGVPGGAAPFEARTSDLYEAIDVAAGKVGRWLGKELEHRRPSAPDARRSDTIRKPRGG